MWQGCLWTILQAASCKTALVQPKRIRWRWTWHVGKAQGMDIWWREWKEDSNFWISRENVAINLPTSSKACSTIWNCHPKWGDYSRIILRAQWRYFFFVAKNDPMSLTYTPYIRNRISTPLSLCLRRPFGPWIYLHLPNVSCHPKHYKLAKHLSNFISADTAVDDWLGNPKW